MHHEITGQCKLLSRSSVYQIRGTTFNTLKLYAVQFIPQRTYSLKCDHVFKESNNICILLRLWHLLSSRFCLPHSKKLQEKHVFDQNREALIKKLLSRGENAHEKARFNFYSDFLFGKDLHFGGTCWQDLLIVLKDMVIVERYALMSK